MKRSILTTDNGDGSHIIRKLLLLIDTYCGIGAELRDLLLELARWMDESRQCQQDEICRNIKYILKEKIGQGKISERWIENSLPKEYKRRYTKSEVSSLSGRGELLSAIETQESEPSSEEDFHTDNPKTIPEKNRNETLQEDINELERCLNGREISESPVQFTIPRSKYENLKAAIEESHAAVYAVFKDGIFEYAFSDNAQT